MATDHKHPGDRSLDCSNHLPTVSHLSNTLATSLNRTASRTLLLTDLRLSRSRARVSLPPLPRTDLFFMMIGRLPPHWQRLLFIISPLFLSSSSSFSPYHFSSQIQFFSSSRSATARYLTGNIPGDVARSYICGRGRRYRPDSFAYINLLAIWHLPIFLAAGGGGAESAGSHYHWWWRFDEVWQRGRRRCTVKNETSSLTALSALCVTLTL